MQANRKSENTTNSTAGMQSIQMGKEAENISQEKTMHNPYPYVVVRNPGTDYEDEVADFATFKEAAMFYTVEQDPFEHWDVMKRLDDGTLTTEF